MQPFEYERATDPQSAVKAVAAAPAAKFLAGGTNLVDLMKQNVELPTHLVDINRLDLAKIEELPDGGLASRRTGSQRRHRRSSAGAGTLPDAGAGDSCRELHRSCVIWRRMAATCCSAPVAITFTIRPTRSATSVSLGRAVRRFTDSIVSMPILGASPACIATHPSDMCVALAALEAVVQCVVEAEIGRSVCGFSSPARKHSGNRNQFTAG